jgi:hypothetical protein
MPTGNSAINSCSKVFALPAPFGFDQLDIAAAVVIIFTHGLMHFCAVVLVDTVRDLEDVCIIT